MTGISSRASIQNAEHRLDDTKRKCEYGQANAVGVVATEGGNFLHRGVDAVMDGVPPSAKAFAWLVGGLCAGASHGAAKRTTIKLDAFSKGGLLHFRGGHRTSMVNWYRLWSAGGTHPPAAQNGLQLPTDTEGDEMHL